MTRNNRSEIHFSVGDRLIDREDDDSELIVLGVDVDTPAREKYIGDLGATVAEVNPEYDPEAPVVTAAYVEDIEREVSRWREIDDLRLAAAHDAIKTYTFPADRLEAVP